MPSTPYADEYDPSNFDALLPVIQSSVTTIIRMNIQIRFVFPYTRLKNVPTPPLTNEAALNCAVLKISIMLRLLKMSWTRSNCSPPFKIKRETIVASLRNYKYVFIYFLLLQYFCYFLI